MALSKRGHGDELSPHLRGYYGNFKLEADRQTYFDNDTLHGNLNCEISNPLSCKVIIVRLRCVLKRIEGKVAYPTTTLYRANRTLTTRCTLQPAGSRDQLDCEGSYTFDFSFALDSGCPNSLLCEVFNPYSKVLVEWYIAALCKTTNDEQILLAKARFVKGALYVPQTELQPKACLGKSFLLDRIFRAGTGRLYVYVSLDKNVYTVGEPIGVKVELVNESGHVRVSRITAKAKQLFRTTFGCEALVVESPSLDTAEIKVGGTEDTFVLRLRPILECTCGSRRGSHRLPTCTRIAHATSKLAGGEGKLAASSSCRQWELGLEQMVNYMVKVTVHVAGGKNAKLSVPFSLANEPEPTARLGAIASAQLVSATPVIDMPPAYDAIETQSTGTCGHIRPMVEVPSGLGAEGGWLDSGMLQMKGKSAPKFKSLRLEEDVVSAQIDGNSIEV
eukprot:comp17996_c0_seq1/m.18431 comp17996_c0_seq1/g.18431  ORF comp17996_c0_seq1/g.18431 comp17996_c0_seq1/m.18431 type:complete len:446 (-) comp17996_c0_seq1:322-1659(-)